MDAQEGMAGSQGVDLLMLQCALQGTEAKQMHGREKKKLKKMSLWKAFI